MKKSLWCVLFAGLGLFVGTAVAADFKPLEFRGKPFFMIGNWDSRMENNIRSVNPFMKAAGMNSVMVFIDFNDAKQYESDMALIRWYRDNHPDMAVIVDLQLPFILQAAGPKKFVPVPAAELPVRKARLSAAVKELQSYGNVIGYSIDELENRLYGTLSEWRKTAGLDAGEMDLALTRYMEIAIQWVAESIRANHPEAFFMPLQAWWTTYGQSDKLYDVLIANDYPVTGDQTVRPTFYSVAYDAQLAAAATAKFGKRCFIYCPPGFNVLKSGAWKDAREYTIEELRYLWFTPISSGAMGVMGWRQRRVTNAYALNTIFPLLSQINALVPWLLGENLDQAVQCSRKQDTTEYKIPKRSRMTDEEDNEFHIRPVRTITWIARRNPADASVMLLACNNSNRPESAFFVFSKPIMAKDSLELFSGQTARVGGRFKVEFKPYDVKVFMLPDAERMERR